jgi:hypothetical protein
MKMAAVRERLQVLTGRKKDPFDNFDAIDLMHDKQLKLFILIGNNGKRDNKISPDHPEWIQRIKKLYGKYEIGIHPSYRSNQSIDFVQEEKKKLEGIIDAKISINRQHFLKLELPETYRNLISIDIQEDYSMGYAEVTGFRAGTSFPFYFYDVLNQKATGLKVFPFAIMDRTLKDYLSLDPESAKDKIEQLIKTIKIYGGNLISIWHNDSLGDSGEWAGWAEVYQFLLKEGNKLNE